MCYYDLNQLETEERFLADQDDKYGNKESGAYFK